VYISEFCKSEVDYGRKIFNSGLEGARSGRETFLCGRPFIPFFRESFCRALKPAELGACLGVLTSCREHERRSIGRILASCVLGGLIGLASGLVWQARFLAASTAGGAVEKISKVRDAHWLEKNPIDYA
jgi:hypothetical protein